MAAMENKETLTEAVLRARLARGEFCTMCDVGDKPIDGLHRGKYKCGLGERSMEVEALKQRGYNPEQIKHLRQWHPWHDSDWNNPQKESEKENSGERKEPRIDTAQKIAELESQVVELTGWKSSAMVQLGKADILRSVLPPKYLGHDIYDAIVFELRGLTRANRELRETVERLTQEKSELANVAAGIRQDLKKGQL